MEEDRFKFWEPPAILHGIPTKWHWVVYHPENLELGAHTDIGAYTFIQAEAGVFIGDRTQIGGGCMIYSVSTIGDIRGPIHIANDVCIGANSVIMPGITISAGAVIGALTFVNRDIDRNEVFYRRGDVVIDWADREMAGLK